eukprot:gene2263-4403_t
MASTIACCLCGIQMLPNDAAMCVLCLKRTVDLTDLIQTNCEVIQCKKCERWHVRQDQWINYDMESTGLLALCLKKINGLSKLKLLDALWIWTEPHSKRLKVAVDVEAEVLDNKVKMQQRLVVEFIIKNKQCMECIRDATDHSWVALIQLRQRVGHKKSLFVIEDLLTKSDLHKIITDVEIFKEGIDFYFRTKSNAERIIEVISSNLPTKIKHSKKLVSQDSHSNTQKYEYTSVIEVASISKNDLVLVPKDTGRQSSFMLVSKLSSSIHLIDPISVRKSEISNARYFAKPFQPILTTKQLVSFVILDIEPVDVSLRRTDTRDGRGDRATLVHERGGLLAEAEIVREADFGVTDNANAMRVLTHLGHILKPGDTALGYDLRHAVLDDVVLDSLSHSLSGDIPDVILVRRSHSDKTQTQIQRVRRGHGDRSRSSQWISSGGGGGGRKSKGGGGGGTGGTGDGDGDDVEFEAFIQEQLDEEELIMEQEQLGSLSTVEKEKSLEMEMGVGITLVDVKTNENSTNNEEGGNS